MGKICTVLCMFEARPLYTFFLIFPYISKDKSAWANDLIHYMTEFMCFVWQILYDDEDEEELWLARGLERVRMLVPLQGHLKAPSPEELHTLSHTLLEQSRLEGAFLT